MFMWLQPSPCPGTTKPFSGEDGEGIVLDRRRSVRYAQKQENKCFFANMTTVLPLSVFWEEIRGPLQSQELLL